MKSYSISLDHSVPRRDFLAVLAAGAAACALCPEDAFAAVGGVTESQKTAGQLWAEAVAQARAEGSPVYENIKSGSGITPRASVTGVNRTSITFVSGSPDVVQAVAIYEVTSANIIGTVHDAWVHGTQCTAIESYYSHTKVDDRRTLVVNFTVTLQNVIGVNQTVMIYSEYGRTGGAGVIIVTYL